MKLVGRSTPLIGRCRPVRSIGRNEKLTARGIEQRRFEAGDRRRRQQEPVKAFARRARSEKRERHLGRAHGARGGDYFKVLPRRGPDQRGAVLNQIARTRHARPREDRDGADGLQRARYRKAEVRVGIGEERRGATQRTLRVTTRRAQKSAAVQRTAREGRVFISGRCFPDKRECAPISLGCLH